MKKIATALLVAAVSVGAQAEGMYGGGGIGINSVDISGLDLDDATGFQFFGGYDLDYTIGDDITTAVEVGYKMSGDFELDTQFGTFSDSADGLWASGVVSYPVSDQISLLGRLGLDLGDDDGLLFGFGGGYDINEQIGVRAEYIIRSDTTAIEFNLTYRP
ncbi:MAG: porin family protein [Pseudomonadales bacterium]|nr:porin family protein [Pseudomonadales bacterium]